MVKEETIMDDGRTLIYYTFEDEDDKTASEDESER